MKIRNFLTKPFVKGTSKLNEVFGGGFFSLVLFFLVVVKFVGVLGKVTTKVVVWVISFY